MKTKNKLLLVLVLGIFIRLLIAPYLTSGAHNRFDEMVRWIFEYGFNPMSWISSMGLSSYFFTSLTYFPSLFLNSLGFGGVSGQQYIEWFLMKIPLIAGDILVFYALCNIATNVSKDENVGLRVGALFFLNPYVIRQSTIAAGDWSLMIGFVLLSLLNLQKLKVSRSAIYLSVAIAFHHIPVLLSPLYLAFLYASSSIKLKIKSFLGTLITSSIIFYFPLLAVIISLYLQGPAFWAFLSGYLGIANPALVTPEGWLQGAELNFTGILATLNLQSDFASFLNVQSFLLIYLVLFIFFLRYRSLFSFQLLNRSIILIFSLLLLFMPLVQYPFLIWILPFLFIESEAFKSIPRFYPHLLWISNLTISTFLSGQFLIYSQYTFLQFTFPINENIWPFRGGFGANLLPLSISALHASLLILIVIFSITSIFGIIRLRRQTFAQSWGNRTIPIFFSIYCLFEILRITYSNNATSFMYNSAAILLSVLAICTIIIGRHVWNNGSTSIDYDRLFNTSVSKIAIHLYLGTLAVITFILIWFNLDFSLFLPLQIYLFIILIRISSQYKSTFNIHRVSMFFTMVYVFLILLISKNVFLEFAIIPFLSLWIYLQFTTTFKLKFRKQITNKEKEKSYEI